MNSIFFFLFYTVSNGQSSLQDRKYGHGGKDKKMAKKNDSKSVNDMREFNPRGGKFVRNEYKGRNKAKAKKSVNRPGKASRQKARSNRKA